MIVIVPKDVTSFVVALDPRLFVALDILSASSTVDFSLFCLYIVRLVLTLSYLCFTLRQFKKCLIVLLANSSIGNGVQKGSQVHFINIAHYHKFILRGITICTAYNVL